MEHPFHQTILYEIGSRIFCNESGKSLAETLAMQSKSLAFQASDQIWCMGVWEKSPGSQNIAQKHPGLQKEYKKALPDFSKKDVIGSPYAIFRYEPNPDFTSWDDLKEAQLFLQSIGKKLILDFVPNHMALDTPYLLSHPDLFLKGWERMDPASPNFFIAENGKVYAHGKDPYFDGWTDTVQWDFSNAKTLDFHIDLLLKIASVCDGVRCDMAMLVLPFIFHRTHGKEGKPYWSNLIQSIKKVNPTFSFYAEAYWDLEYTLQTMGFDGTYDKTLYDRMHSSNNRLVADHLLAELSYQEKSIRFLENHDEPRAFSVFGLQSRAYFALLCFLPGIVLFHEKQEEGYAIKIPVQLGRRQAEKRDDAIFEFYARALQTLADRGKHLIQKELHPLLLSGESVWTRAVVGKNIEVFIWNPSQSTSTGYLPLHSALGSTKIPLEIQDIVSGEKFKDTEESRGARQIYFSLEPGEAQWFVFD